MSRYISEEIRQTVATTANARCEYCLTPQEHSYFPFHIDHILPIKHGGLTILENLAYACVYCNRNKGSDITSVLLPDYTIIRLFHPRTDDWSTHFYFENARIQSSSNIGMVTAKILDFNHPQRIEERQVLIDSDRFWL